jgi:hypothetical protein
LIQARVRLVGPADRLPAHVPERVAVAQVKEAAHQVVAAKDVEIADAPDPGKELDALQFADLVVEIAHARLLDVGKEGVVSQHVVKGARGARVGDGEL